MINIEIKFIASDSSKKLMNGIVKAIYERNKSMFDNECDDKIEAIWFIRYTSKTPDGEVVLRFQEESTNYGRLEIPRLSDDEEDDRYTESSVGPLKYVIWTLRFSDIFKIEGKGMSARVFVREGIFDTLRGLGD